MKKTWDEFMKEINDDVEASYRNKETTKCYINYSPIIDGLVLIYVDNKDRYSEEAEVYFDGKFLRTLHLPNDLQEIGEL